MLKAWARIEWSSAMLMDSSGNLLPLQDAPLIPRIIAYLTDRFLMTVFTLIVVWFVTIILSTPFTASFFFDQLKFLFDLTKTFLSGENPFLRAAATIVATFTLTAVILGIYFFFVLPMAIWEYFQNGVSPGKKLFHLRVLNTHGIYPSFSQIFTRNFFKDLESSTGILFILCSKNRQSFTDIALGTVVVQDPTWTSELPTTFECLPSVLQKYEIQSLEDSLGLPAIRLPGQARFQVLLWQREMLSLLHSAPHQPRVVGHLADRLLKKLLLLFPELQDSSVAQAVNSADVQEKLALLAHLNQAIDREILCGKQKH
jgi:uncharacterized RDD family membrane protein YckC